MKTLSLPYAQCFQWHPQLEGQLSYYAEKPLTDTHACSIHTYTGITIHLSTRAREKPNFTHTQIYLCTICIKQIYT